MLKPRYRKHDVKSIATVGTRYFCSLCFSLPLLLCMRKLRQLRFSWKNEERQEENRKTGGGANFSVDVDPFYIHL